MILFLRSRTWFIWIFWVFNTWADDWWVRVRRLKNIFFQVPGWVAFVRLWAVRIIPNAPELACGFVHWLSYSLFRFYLSRWWYEEILAFFLLFYFDKWLYSGVLLTGVNCSIPSTESWFSTPENVFELSTTRKNIFVWAFLGLWA